MAKVFEPGRNIFLSSSHNISLDVITSGNDWVNKECA